MSIQWPLFVHSLHCLPSAIRRSWRLNVLPLTAIFCLPQLLGAGERFSETPLPLNVQAHSWCDAACADIDNDGDLDFVFSSYNVAVGTGDTKAVMNEGDGEFIVRRAPDLQQGLAEPAIAWADYDGDGRLDLLFGGHNPGLRFSTMLYHNEGDCRFTTHKDIKIFDSWAGQAAWGDFDNDGDPDILLQGADRESRRTLLYQNGGGLAFRELFIPAFPQVSQGTVAWADFDNDGDLDAFISGFQSIVSKLCRNSGDSFHAIKELYLPGLNAAAAAWGDYDADGRLDIFFTGWQYPDGGDIASLYHNNGDDTFTEQKDNDFLAVINSSVSWGDCDNDGDLDLLVTGARENNQKYFTRLYVNKGNGRFKEDSSAHLQGAYIGRAEWTDFDNDGDLDILLAGAPGVIKMYRNNCRHSNTLPRSPSNLRVIPNGSSAAFSWDKASDAETPQAGLTYNLRIVNADGREVMPAMADPRTGRRRIVQMGNTGHNCSWTIRNLAPGSYRASVQSIDNCWAGSTFSEEITFNISVGGPAFVDPWTRYISTE